MALLDVRNLTLHFHTRAGVVRAVEQVGFSLHAGETLALVGESGSGKSVTCLALLGLIPCPPGRVETGTAHFDGVDLLHASPKTLRSIRGSRISMVFQEPMSTLNPYLRVGTQLIEPLRLHRRIRRREARARAEKALLEVGIQDPRERLQAYPHELSGGMRQRVTIAMALITEPDILIADEPTTALDVTVQAQILDLIRTLQRATGTAVLFVTHDLSVVAGFCDRIAVMYAGQLLELGSTDDIFYQPMHPYTEALRRSLPVRTKRQRELYAIPGQPPDLVRPPAGCPFAPRCTQRREVCSQPVHLQTMGEKHLTACTRRQRGEI